MLRLGLHPRYPQRRERADDLRLARIESSAKYASGVIRAKIVWLQSRTSKDGARRNCKAFPDKES